MKITVEKDRIHWQSENERESQALIAVMDLVFHAPGADEDIANDHGCTDGKFNYCCTPLPMTPEESKAACLAGNQLN